MQHLLTHFNQNSMLTWLINYNHCTFGRKRLNKLISQNYKYLVGYVLRKSGLLQWLLVHGILLKDMYTG